MPALSTNWPTLADWQKTLDPDGSIARVIEILNEQNEILMDAVWIEGNLPTGHRSTIRSGLPTPTWRLLNYGVQPDKSTKVQVDDACGMLEAYSEVDKALAVLNGNTNAFRLSEARAHIESMNQEMVNTLFYGSTATDPEKFMGLSPRFNSLSANNGENIISGSGSSSDNTSIWLVVWAPDTCAMIYPKGSSQGLMVEDLGEDTLTDSNGGRYQGYRTHFVWKPGLALRDWRYVVRIANIDVTDLTKNASAGADLIDLMSQALEQVQNLNAGRPCFYVNRTIRSFLRRQISNKSNVNLTLDNAGGKTTLSFGEVPIRRCDAILNTESAVS